MKKYSKRILSLCLALMLTLGVLTAFAPLEAHAAACAKPEDHVFVAKKLVKTNRVVVGTADSCCMDYAYWEGSCSKCHAYMEAALVTQVYHSYTIPITISGRPYMQCSVCGHRKLGQVIIIESIVDWCDQ